MSTTARIGIELPSGKVKASYCHFDGYPEGVGKTLLYHYSDRNKLESLIDLGTLRVLKPLVDPDPNLPHVLREEAQDDVTEAYGKDGEPEDYSPPEILDSLEKYFEAQYAHDYAYVYTKEGKWLARCMHRPFARGRKFNTTIEDLLEFTNEPKPENKI